MASYIRYKKRVLRQFKVAQSVINAIPWDRLKTETAIDNYCRDIIFISLGGEL